MANNEIRELPENHDIGLFTYNQMHGELQDELEEWEMAAQDDSLNGKALLAVKTKTNKFPAQLSLKVSISGCSLSNIDRFLFQGRLWVPDGLNLRVKLIQAIHDSPQNSHQEEKLHMQ